MKILIVSRFVPWKRIEKVKEIIKRLKGLPFEFNIVGGGNQEIEQKIKTLVRQKTAVKVNFLGEISPKGVYKEFNKADSFLSLTCYEPFAISLIEAIAAGLSVVAPKVSGIPEVIKDGETGLLYREGNWAMAAEKIKLLTHKKALHKKISNKGWLMAKDYDINKNLNKIINFYKQVKS